MLCYSERVLLGVPGSHGDALAWVLRRRLVRCPLLFRRLLAVNAWHALIFVDLVKFLLCDSFAGAGVVGGQVD